MKRRRDWRHSLGLWFFSVWLFCPSPICFFGLVWVGWLICCLLFVCLSIPWMLVRFLRRDRKGLHPGGRGGEDLGATAGNYRSSNQNTWCGKTSTLNKRKEYSLLWGKIKNNQNENQNGSLDTKAKFPAIAIKSFVRTL